MILLSDDPVRDFIRHDAQEYEAVKMLPVCSECEESIVDEYYDVDGRFICCECMKDHKRSVE